MAAHPLLPDPACLTLDCLTVRDGAILFAARTAQSWACCPVCGCRADRVHSHYRRTLLDLPWQGNAVTIEITAHRFFCDNRDCNRRIFAEPIPTIAARYARKTERLTEALRELTLLVGGEAAARIAAAFGLPVSPDALLDALQKAHPSPFATPRVLGVDDFAFKKGQRYGTLLIDLERHCPVDLLPDRSAESLAAWLQDHPGVEVISRDRAGVYAEGARQGAPGAVQIADRWHLLHNVVEALERFLGRQHQHLAEAARSAAARSAATQITPEAMLTDTAPATAAVAPRISTRAQREQQARHERQRSRYQSVVELQRQGVSIRAIAEQRGMSRRDVRRFLRAASFEDAFPEQPARHPRPNQLDRYAPYLRQRWEEGCRNVAQLHRELLERGFRGAASALRAYLAPWRVKPPLEMGRARGQLPHRATVWATPSPRCAAWLLLGCQRGKLSQKAGRSASPSEKEAFAQAFVDCLCERCADVQTARTLSLAFFAMVRGGCADALEGWMNDARESGIVELAGLATGLSRDRAAVAAGVSLCWSNGQTEGQVNRLKFLKRSMYGQGSFDLLKARVLHRATVS